jgi:hypothetical protein
MGDAQRLLRIEEESPLFSLGTTEAYKKDDEQKERTEWHPAKRGIVFFGKLAEIAGEYLSNGLHFFQVAQKRSDARLPKS